MLPLLWLALAAAPVVGPAVSPGTPVPAPAGSQASQMRVASDGTFTAVVYLDDREAFPTVWAAQLSAAQTLLDPHDLRVDGPYAADPVITHSRAAPASFLMVWERDGLRARRLTPGGGFVDAAPKLLVPAPAYAPAIASDPSTNYLVWRDAPFGTGTLRLARVDATATVVSTPQALFTGTIEHPRIAASGAALLITWTSGMSINALRVQTNGTLIDAAPLTLDTTSDFAPVSEVVATAAGWYVTVSTQGPTYAVRGVAVPPSGAVPASRGLTTDAEFSALTYDEPGGRAVVAWTYRADGKIYGLRFAPGDPVLPAPALIRDAGSEQLALTATAPLGVQVVWNEARFGGPATDLFASRAADTLALIDGAGVVVSQAGSFQDAPRLATDGAAYLLVWQEYRNLTGWDIWGSVVAADGSVGAAFPIRTAPGAQRRPRLAFAAGVYLVAWTDDAVGRAQFARVSAAGQLLDSIPFTVPTAGNDYDPSVAGSGDTFLAAYSDSAIRARQYRPDAGWSAAVTVSTTGDLVHDAEGSPGAGWVVVYASHAAGYLQTVLNRISEGGAVLDGDGVAVTLASSDPYEPSLTFDGQRFLAAWHDHRPPGVSGYVFGAHVDPVSGVAEPSGYRIGPTDGTEQQNQCMARVGDGTFLIWGSNGNTMKWQALFGTTVSPAVDLVPPVTIFTPPSDLAATRDTMAWAYAEMLDGDRRVVVRTVGLGPLGAACAEPWECHSGRCAPTGTCAEPATAGDAGAGADAGTPPDAGVSPADAGTLPDGGTVGPRQLAVGCGCSEGAGATPALALILLGLARLTLKSTERMTHRVSLREQRDHGEHRPAGSDRSGPSDPVRQSRHHLR